MGQRLPKNAKQVAFLSYLPFTCVKMDVDWLLLTGFASCSTDTIIHAVNLTVPLQ